MNKIKLFIIKKDSKKVKKIIYWEFKSSQNQLIYLMTMVLLALDAL